VPHGADVELKKRQVKSLTLMQHWKSGHCISGCSVLYWGSRFKLCCWCLQTVWPAL